MDCSPPGSSIHGIFQVRVLEWVAFPFSRGSSWLRDQTQVSQIACRLFTSWATRKAQMHKKIFWRISAPVYDKNSPESGIEGIYLKIINDMYDKPFYTVHGVLMASILEWFAILFTSGSHFRMEWKLIFSSPVATAEFSKFAGILSEALSHHHLLRFEIAQLEFHHLH